MNFLSFRGDLCGRYLIIGLSPLVAEVLPSSGHGGRKRSSLYIISSRKHSLISQTEQHTLPTFTLFTPDVWLWLHICFPGWTSSSLETGTCPLHFLGTGSGPKWTTEDSNVTKVDSCFLSKLKKKTLHGGENEKSKWVLCSLLGVIIPGSLQAPVLHSPFLWWCVCRAHTSTALRCVSFQMLVIFFFLGWRLLNRFWLY